MDTQTLIVAYGNASRRDDGVAFHIVRRLRQRLGLPSYGLEEDADGELVAGVEVITLHQLAPELAEDLAQMDVVVFIDAHVQAPGWQDLHWQEISPGLRPSMVTHQLKPEAVLSLCQTLYGRVPRTYVLSVLGVDFDFGEQLSPATERLADQAAEQLLAMLVSQGSVRADAQEGVGP